MLGVFLVGVTAHAQGVSGTASINRGNGGDNGSSVGKKTTTTTDYQSLGKDAIVTSLLGKQIEVIAGNTVTSQGANFKATGGITHIEGANQTNLYAVAKQSIDTQDSKKTSSWLGIGLGKSTTNATQFNTQALTTQLASTERIVVGIGESATLEGTSFTAPASDANRLACEVIVR